MMPVSFDEANMNSKTHGDVQYKMFCDHVDIKTKGATILTGLGCVIKYQPSFEDIEAIIRGGGIYVITFAAENTSAADVLHIPCIDVTTENPFEQSE